MYPYYLSFTNILASQTNLINFNRLTTNTVILCRLIVQFFLPNNKSIACHNTCCKHSFLLQQIQSLPSLLLYARLSIKLSIKNRTQYRNIKIPTCVPPCLHHSSYSSESAPHYSPSSTDLFSSIYSAESTSPS
ncbi:hypothetical protein SAMN02910263_00291 [Butyrivibrio sp. INlla16]|nr:hypothetical protein SAMN02910263_00291 [Butyrivibrio sp. INlla16]